MAKTKNENILYKLDIVDMIANDKTFEGISKAKITGIVDSTFENILKVLKSGKQVTFVGIGSFKPFVSKARKGVNPRTKAAIDIPSKKSVKFYSSEKYDSML
jgi:DNA-binding protein HU-beta